MRVENSGKTVDRGNTRTRRAFFFKYCATNIDCAITSKHSSIVAIIIIIIIILTRAQGISKEDYTLALAELKKVNISLYAHIHLHHTCLFFFGNEIFPIELSKYCPC